MSFHCWETYLKLIWIYAFCQARAEANVKPSNWDTSSTRARRGLSWKRIPTENELTAKKLQSTWGHSLPRGSALRDAGNQRIHCKKPQRNVTDVGEPSSPFSFFLISVLKRNICFFKQWKGFYLGFGTTRSWLWDKQFSASRSFGLYRNHPWVGRDTEKARQIRCIFKPTTMVGTWSLTLWGNSREMV